MRIIDSLMRHGARVDIANNHGEKPSCFASNDIQRLYGVLPDGVQQDHPTHSNEESMQIELGLFPAAGPANPEESEAVGAAMDTSDE